ncbi:MAG: right-handed parallel beta-helix repeat-containing protein [archaeon]|nr:right-handed parallel beta-helix repeat-containing protein [archaeon]
MKRIIGTITIAMLLMMPLLLMMPIQVIAQPTMKLSDAISGGTGGIFYLNPSILYTGGVTITGTTRIYGQGAMIDLRWAEIEIVNTYLYIERCTITNGTGIRSGALQFLDGASGFVYNNIIVNNHDNGIEIIESSNIIIKENSIIQNWDDGIYFMDSTDITILENIIANNDVVEVDADCGIYGNNLNLYLEDPNSLHNIKIKGNKISTNHLAGIELRFVNDVSIASNIIFANEGHGIFLEYCPIVSITYNKILVNYYLYVHSVPIDDFCGIYYSGDSSWDPNTIELSLTISYNKILGNIGNGIYIKNTNNIVITYNEIMWNGGGGIEIVGNPEPVLFVVENVLIAYNTISENGGMGIYRSAILVDGIDNDMKIGPSEGIDMNIVSHVKIIFNKITGNHGLGIDIDGLYLDTGSSILGEDLLIKGNVITGNSGGGIGVDYFNVPVIIEWNTILGNGDGGIYLYHVESPQILHNTIMYQYEYFGDYSVPACGILMHECDGARIAYNTIAYNMEDNIYVDKPSEDVIIEYNFIVGSTDDGIEADGCIDMTIQYNKIYDNEDNGIDWWRCSGLIANNIIGYTGSLSGNHYGIYLDDCLSTVPDLGLTTISDNTIIGNNHGIHCAGSDPTIVRNYIANNVYGIWLGIGKGIGSDAIIGGSYDNRNYIIRNYADGIFIDDLITQSEPKINYNNIYENVGYGINNWAAVNLDVGAGVTIDAENNWWGDISGPGNPLTFGVGPGSGDEVTDYVDYIPWLTTPIP